MPELASYRLLPWQLTCGVNMALFRCVYKGCILEIRSSEDRAVNRRTLKAGALEIGIREIAGLDVGVLENRALQICALKAGGDEAATEVRVLKHRA